MEKVNSQHPVILDEHYEIEFIEDSGHVYEAGEQMDATDFIEDFCRSNSSEFSAHADWLRDKSVPWAVAYIAEMWSIKYKLHRIKTIDEIIH